ncbi:MAG: bifunctional phosphopantothenoylcysteine decarboxylase/phosphopantothenate--cysteine ligase CoaBC [Mucinivorans sp.]
MKVLLAVTGGIAAYKAALLVRLLVKSGHQVRVIMTRSAKDFITPLTLATLSGNPIVVENFDPENGAWNSHISLGEWADVMLIAPATANTLAKMAAGIADNLLLCTYLSARCPVWVVPAMDLEMYAHKTTQENLSKLRATGVHIIEPDEGFLASGLIGRGRMAEPEEILKSLFTEGDMSGHKVLITAGGTIEMIDPVRFISNFSSGKMGFALAEELLSRGAEVTMVVANHTVQIVNVGIKQIKALSANAMLEAVSKNFVYNDIVIFAAAVADYTPAKTAEHKIKHSNTAMNIELQPTVDIAKKMCQNKSNGQFCIGFALESQDGISAAHIKLKSKNLDAIVLNSLEDKGAGFGGDTNKITIIDTLHEQCFELKSKREVARDIVDYIASKKC